VESFVVPGAVSTLSVCALLEFAKPKTLVGAAGDLLVIKGGEVLHRGVTTREDGERLVFVATYNPVGTKPTPLWDWFARRLNY